MTDREPQWNQQQSWTGDYPTAPAPPWWDGPQDTAGVPTAPIVTGGPGYVGPPPSSNRARNLLIALAGALAVLLIAGAVAVLVRQRSGTPDPVAQASPPAAQPVPADPTDDPAPGYGADDGNATDTPDATEPAGDPPTEEATTDPQRAALDQLAAIHERDLSTVSFHGQYVAQLASKNQGISDPYQTAADGTHIFQATDILAEHQRLRERVGGSARVVLLQSTDYGKRQLYHGEPLWVTFALGDFPSKKAVLNWCARRSPELSGEELANQCAARRLQP